MLDRVSTLALMYRITRREPTCAVPWETRAAANFRDWNPALFADTAEMAHAFALGYDWLYNSLSPDERAWIRDAIVQKALDQAIPIYQRESGWPRRSFQREYSLQRGHGPWRRSPSPGRSRRRPMTGHRKREVRCGSALRVRIHPHGLSTYGVEGSWPEGHSYWESVTMYACAFFGALQTALGNDYGLSASHGVDRAGRFRFT